MYEGDLRAGALGAGTRSEEEEEEEEEEGEERVAVKGSLFGTNSTRSSVSSWANVVEIGCAVSLVICSVILSSFQHSAQFSI